MIGNDIVDLSEASKSNRTLDPRYLDKTFSKAEQDFILSSVNPEAGLWLLWSMKESAYKIYIGNHKKAFYAPAKFQCEVIDENKGLVKINNEVYHTYSAKTKSFIHTIARANSTDRFLFDITRLNNPTYENQHRSGHTKLKSIYSVNTGKDSAYLVIRKNTAGIPQLFHKGKKTNLTFSLSHHGHYAAVAMLTG